MKKEPEDTAEYHYSMALSFLNSVGRTRELPFEAMLHLDRAHRHLAKCGRKLSLAKNINQTGTGTFAELECALLEEAPESMGFTFSRSRSRKVEPGTLGVVFVQHDPRPWWRFWA